MQMLVNPVREPCLFCSVR